MMRSIASMLAVILAGGAVALPVTASEIGYSPVNPSFGGNPVNGSYLFNMATAQRKETATSPSAPGLPPLNNDPIDRFKSSLTSRLLSSVSDQIADAMYGDNPQDSGSFTVDDLQIDFHRESGQLVVNVLDGATGGQTVIQLPILQ